MLADGCFAMRRPQGNLVEWKVAEGGEIAAGESLAEVETDKATMDWEAQDEGYLAKILVPGGTKDIPVGTLVAIVVDDKDEVSAASARTGGPPLLPAAGRRSACSVHKPLSVIPGACTSRCARISCALCCAGRLA